jgi:hypothetical protein
MHFIIGAGGEKDRASLQLYTRSREFIPNETRLESLPARLQAAKDILGKNHPRAKLRSSTSTYNCMGLVFASRRTWVDPEYIRLILRGDEYQRVANLFDVQIGDIVLYSANNGKGITHVGIVVEVIPQIRTGSFQFKVMSKWGADGEYIHFMEDVPKQLGHPCEYWTDRR